MLHISFWVSTGNVLCDMGSFLRRRVLTVCFFAAVLLASAADQAPKAKKAARKGGVLERLPPWATTNLTSVEEAMRFVGPTWRKRAVVLGCFTKDDKDKAAAVALAARYNRDPGIAYAVTLNPLVCEQYKHTAPAMLVFNPYEPSPMPWAKNVKDLKHKTAVLSFARMNSHPLVAEFDGSKEQGLRLRGRSKGDRPMLVMISLDYQSPKTKSYMRQLRELAAAYHGSNAFFFYASHTNQRVNKMLKIEPEHTPSIISLQLPYGKPVRETQLTGPSQIKHFVTNIMGPPDKWKALKPFVPKNEKEAGEKIKKEACNKPKIDPVFE